MNWHRLRGWLETHDKLHERKPGGAKGDLDELATRVAGWCSLVLRLGKMTSKYGALAAASVQTPGRHHLAVMLYGSSLTEYQAARASLRASVTGYSTALEAEGATPDHAIRMTLAIVQRPTVAANRTQPTSDPFMLALRADITTWCRDAHTSSTRAVVVRTTPLRTSPARMADGIQKQRSVRQRNDALEHRNPL